MEGYIAYFTGLHSIHYGKPRAIWRIKYCFINMYVLILLLPLLSFILSSTLGFFLGRYGATFISLIWIGFTFLLSLLIFYEVGLCGL